MVNVFRKSETELLLRLQYKWRDRQYLGHINEYGSIQRKHVELYYIFDNKIYLGYYFSEPQPWGVYDVEEQLTYICIKNVKLRNIKRTIKYLGKPMGGSVYACPDYR